MKIFTDYHHLDLYYALHSLFEKRLGFSLYRPTGFCWKENGYWHLDKFHKLDAYADLMLNPGGVMDRPWIPGVNYIQDNVYHLFEPIHEYWHRAVTFETFKSIKFDLMICSLEIHDHLWKELHDKYQPQAKLISHCGNTGQKTTYNNVIHSVPFKATPKQNTVLCHQELDSSLYVFSPPPKTRTISSVTHWHPYPEIFSKYKELLTDVTMRSYGLGGPDGGLFGAKGVAVKMKESNIGWHLKPQGGLGHSAMGWMYSGRPIITNMSQHRSWGGNAIKLFEPGVTCHDIEAHTVEENCKAIRRMLEPEENIKWCERAKQRFHEIIDYDKEEQDVRKFLEKLI